MSNLEAVSNTHPVEQFLDYLWDGLSGYAYLPILDRTTDVFIQKFFQWPEQKVEAIDWILTHCATKDVYAAPAIWRTQQISRNTFKESNVVWTEFDGTIPTSERLGTIPIPTLRIQSSTPGFEHWYWKLQSPCNSVTEIESTNRSITYTFGADASSWDCTQILRIPGTTNHKKSTQVYVVEQSETLVETISFQALPEFPQQEYDFTPDSVPDTFDVLLKYPFPEEVVTLFKAATHPVGERSSALMRLGYYLAEIGLTDGEMFSLIRNADDRWGKFKGRQDRDRRLVDIIAKSRLKYPDVVDISEDADVFPIFGWKSLLESEITIEWLIPGLLQAQGYMLLTGKAGVGKTQLSLQAAIHMGLGKEFLGFEVTRKMRVLIMSMEMGHADIKDFITTMSKTLTAEELETLQENILIAPVGEPIHLDTPKGQEMLRNILSVTKPDLFMWDSFGSSSSGDLVSEGPVKSVMQFNDKIRKEFGVASWFIHHNRKATADNKKPKGLDDVYGNQYLVNRASSVYCLWPVGDNDIEVIPLKKRLSKLEKPWAIHRRDNDLSFERRSIISGIVEDSDNVVSLDFGGVTDDEIENRSVGGEDFNGEF